LVPRGRGITEKNKGNPVLAPVEMVILFPQKDVLIPVLKQKLRTPTLLVIHSFKYFHSSLVVSIGCKSTVHV
jgi:hypothetical protein